MITNTTVEPIVFKQEFAPQNGWLNYGLAMTVLLILIFVLAKKYKPRSPNLDGCQLIEKKHLGNKTIVYIIDYQQQRFLLADNQNALAIHPLEHHNDNTANVGASGARPSLGQQDVGDHQKKGEQPLAPTLYSNKHPNHLVPQP